MLTNFFTYCHTLGDFSKVTCSVCVRVELHERLLSCSLKNSEKPRRVPISEVPTARREKASTIYETPLHFTLNQVEGVEYS